MTSRDVRRRKVSRLILAGDLLCALFRLTAVAETLPTVEPQTVGMSAETLSRIDPAVEQALAAKKMPGCVVCIGRYGFR